MQITDLSRIDRTIEIKAPPARVYQALTSTAEVAEWFQVKIEGTIEQGAEVWMISSPEHGSMRFLVKIAELTPPRRVVWQWHPGAVDKNFDYSKEAMTTVTFGLEPTAKGTKVTVSETGFDALSLERRAKAHADNSQGWTEVVVWLQKYVEAKS
jgi:uncharacterized protein YndB with AHSA1/START domain